MQVYMYQAALYCEECGEKIREDLTAKGEAPDDPKDEESYDSDDFPKGPLDAGESDCPDHCDACALFLENDLTDAGRKYVAAKVAEGRAKGAKPWIPSIAAPAGQRYGGPDQFSRPSEEWADFYGVGDEPEDEPDYITCDPDSVEP